jgi:uncharacterized protein YukE
VADQLGVATLLIGVNTRAAEAALKAFVGKAESILSSANTNAFSGLAKGADTAGKAAGEKLAKGIKNAVTGLKFDNIEEALNFSGALNGTIADLKTYKAALLALRDATKTTTPGFKELNGEIESVSAAIKSLSTSTDDLNDLLNRTDASRFADDMKLWAAALRENDAALRDTNRAIRDADRSLRNYDKASNDAVNASQRQAAAARELRDAYLGVAGAAVKAAAGAVGTAVNVGKGAVGAVGNLAKGAVKVGKAGYQVGSEFGIFDAPSTGPVKKAIQEVTDRFAYLGEQAKTTRGIILRSIEGFGAAVGLTELSQQLNNIREALAGLSTTSSAANTAVSVLEKLGQYSDKLNGLLGFTNADTFVGKLASIGKTAETAVSGTVHLSDSLIQLGVKGLTGALNNLDALGAALNSIPPEAAGATVAITAVLALLKAPIEDQLKDSLIDLGAVFQMVEEQAIQTDAKLKNVGAFIDSNERLQNFYNNLANPPKQLPSTEMLEPKRKGLQRLQPSTSAERAGEAQKARLAQQKLEDAFATNLRIGLTLPNAIERGARWFQKQAEYAQQVAEYSKSAKDNQLKPALNGEFSQIPRASQNLSGRVEGPAVPAPVRKDAATAAKEEEASAKRLRNLHRQAADEVRKRRLALQQAAAETKKENDLLNQQRQKRALSSIDEQLVLKRQDRAAKEKSSSAATRRLKDASGSAIIGGAFPLLFGQGAGASLGGGLGGLAGGALGGQFGFGLSLIGTAFGTFVDDAVKKTGALVDALKDPIAGFEALKEASLLSSKGLQTNIDSLIKAGREEEAAALIRGDIAKQFGDGKEFKALQDAYDSVSRSLSKLGVSMVDGLAPALTTAANAIADFIDKLSGVSVKRAGADIQQAKAFIGNDPSRQAEFDKLFKEQGGQYGSGGKFKFGSIGAAVKASRQLLENNGQLTEEQKAQAKEAKDYAGAVGRTVALRKLERQLILESNSGNRLNTLEYERQKLLFERTRALNLAPANDAIAADKIRSDFAEKLLKNEQDITKEKRDQLAADVASRNKIAAGKDQASIARQSLNLSGTGVGALQASASYREAIRAQQNAQAALNASPADPAAIRNLREASAAVETASATARTQLVEAFRAARREAQDAAASLQDAYVNLLQLRTGNNGLNNYLSAQDRSNREKETFKALLPQFELAKQQARNILGNQNFDRNFTGSTEAVNQEMINFIRAVQQEKQAGTGLNRAQEEFVKAQNSLQVATEQLTNFLPGVQQSAIEVVAGLQALVEKQWNVGVTVNRDTGAVDVSNAYAR